MHITPTVGRVVHYFRDRDSEEQVALIAHVNEDSTVNLAVFDHNGTPEPRPAGIRLVQEDEVNPLQGHYCAWMQYQLGQAAKTEAMVVAMQTSAGQLKRGETSFHNENTGFGGVFASTNLMVSSDPAVAEAPIPVLNEVVGQGGTFDGGGATGDWETNTEKYIGSGLQPTEAALEEQAKGFGDTSLSVQSYDPSPSSTESSSYSSSDSSSSSSFE